MDTRVISIDNTGPRIAVAIFPPYAGSYIMTNIASSVVTVTALSTNPAIAVVSLYREQASTSALIGRDSVAPYQFTVSASDLPTNSLLTLRVVASTADGRQTVCHCCRVACVCACVCLYAACACSLRVGPVLGMHALVMVWEGT